jgi:plasmid stability protein
MGAITIRDIDEAVLAAIKRRAGERGVSMEEEVRHLLDSTYSDERAARLESLRRKLNASIEQGGEVTDEQIDAALARKRAALASDGF